jgi:ankyrin repeat protein
MPYEAIEKLTKAYPQSLRIAGNNDYLPLHIACWYGSEQAIQLLAEKFPEAVGKTTKHDGDTPLRCLLNRDNGRQVSVHIVELVLGSYPEALTMQNKFKRTPLFTACWKGADVQVVQMLLDQGFEALHKLDK